MKAENNIVRTILLSGLLVLVLGVASVTLESLILGFIFMGALLYFVLFMPAFLWRSMATRENRAWGRAGVFLLAYLLTILLSLKTPLAVAEIRDLIFKHQINRADAVVEKLRTDPSVEKGKLSTVDPKTLPGLPTGVIGVWAAHCGKRIVVMLFTSIAGRIHSGYLYMDSDSKASCQEIIPSDCRYIPLTGNWYQFSD